ncbi:MAG: DsbA family oxidoreductase [Steroidobacteraceae bacterium]
MSNVVPIQIDFVSDVACPWCAVGLKSLEEALRRTQDVVAADLRFQPFELNPDLPPEGENRDAHLARKYGRSPGELESTRSSLHERAKSLGFEINSSSKSRMYNTFDAHRLLHWAHTQGRQRELKHALLKANFTDDVNVSDPDELTRIAASAGLDATQARDVLDSSRYTQEIRDAERRWIECGITGVPGIVINGKWLISGGQPPEMFEQALRQIATEVSAASKPARSKP